MRQGGSRNTGTFASVHPVHQADSGIVDGMTWIVGAPTMFGYGFGISDVRVTLADESEIDCLQKIYSIGRHFAAGFAGSVKIGFAMLDELRRLSNYSDERIACDPNAILCEWPPCARVVFGRFNDAERAGACHLMLIMAHPQEHVGNPAWPRSFVYIFKSPSFEGETVSVHTLGSIGSGSSYPRCRDAIASFGADRRREQLYMQGEIGCQGGMASMLGLSLTDILKEVQPRGVSPHMHYCWVYRGRTIIQRNDHTMKGRWTIASLGSGINQVSDVEIAPIHREPAKAEGSGFFEMPKLATSWDELLELLRNRYLNASGCTA